MKKFCFVLALCLLWALNAGAIDMGDLSSDVTITQATGTDSDVDLIKVGGTSVDTNAGFKSAGTLRVIEASDSTVVSNLNIVKDWDDSDYCNTNINIAGTDVAGDAGYLNAQTVRVVEASDSTVVTKLGYLGSAIGATDSTAVLRAMYTAGRASSTVQPAVDDGDLVPSWHDTYGRQVNYGSNMAEGAQDVSPVARGPITSGYSQIIDTTLDDSPDSITSSTVYIGDKTKVAFYLATDETEVGNSVSVEYRFFVSPDNSTWIDLETLFDKNGTDAPVSIITHTGDDEETAWLPIGSVFEYIKVFAVGFEVDVNDTAVVDVWLSWSKN